MTEQRDRACRPDDSADVMIRGTRPGGEFRERRGRSADMMPNEPLEVNVVPWSAAHLVASLYLLVATRWPL